MSCNSSRHNVTESSLPGLSSSLPLALWLLPPSCGSEESAKRARKWTRTAKVGWESLSHALLSCPRAFICHCLHQHLGPHDEPQCESQRASFRKHNNGHAGHMLKWRDWKVAEWLLSSEWFLMFSHFGQKIERKQLGMEGLNTLACRPSDTEIA